MAKIDPKNDALSMQWIDIDMYQTSNILRKNPKLGDRIPGASVGTVPVIRIYGVNDIGNSIVMHVHGFTPYFYVQAPPGFQESQTAAFRVALDNQVRNSARGVKVPMYILGCSVCEKQSIWGYSDKKSKFMKIYTALPNFVPTARNILQNGFEVPGTIPRREYLCYESNTPFVLRFMIDQDIVGCNWLEVPAGMVEWEWGGIKNDRSCVFLFFLCCVLLSAFLSHAPHTQTSSKTILDIRYVQCTT